MLQAIARSGTRRRLTRPPKRRHKEAVNVVTMRPSANCAFAGEQISRDTERAPLEIRMRCAEIVTTDSFSSVSKEQVE